MSISACSILEPYEANLGQGNFVRAEQVAQLEVGQTPKQVMLILGSPLLTGENSEQRWIYTSYDEQTGYSKLIVNFSNGLVSAIEQED